MHPHGSHVNVDASAFICHALGMKNEPHMHAWARLVRAHGAVHDAIEAALKVADLPPLDWYDVLLEVERAGSPIRARALEAELLMAQYNLSRLLDRIEAKGLIARRPDPEDGRSRLITITAEGKRQRAAMWPIYAGAVRAMVRDRLDDAEIETLAALLGRIAGR
jgi:DNA-binding MarR family transcriptional regulator